MGGIAPDSDVSWESLCREYPATFGGLVGNGFYREQWIEQYRQNVEVFDRPPSLQRARRFARPIELAARLLAYGLPPGTVRECVFETESHRDLIYAALNNGNGQKADNLLHLFVVNPRPEPGETIQGSMVERVRRISNELSDTTPAPEPNSTCPPRSPADQNVKWPTPEQIEKAIGDQPDSAIDEINAISDRLDGLFGDPAESSQSPIVRTLQGHVTYSDSTTDAQIWQMPVEVIRSWARGEPSSWGPAVGTNAALRAAERLEQLIAELPNERRQTLPPHVFADVRQLVTLIGTLFPIECELCHEPFIADAPGATWCHDCRTGKGQMQSVSIALSDWWKHRNRLAESLAHSTEFNDLRQAIFRRLGVLIGDNGKQWNQSEVDQQRDAWERAKLFLRECYKRPSISEDEWLRELLTMPIRDAALRLGDGLGLFGKAAMGHAGALADIEAAASAGPLSDADRQELLTVGRKLGLGPVAVVVPPMSATAENPKRPEQAGDRAEPGSNSSTGRNDDSSGNEPLRRLLSVFTNGMADERLGQAVSILADEKLKVNDKLTAIDRAIRFPATASAQQLGDLLGVSKQAVLKTAWWEQNRQGEKAKEVVRRETNHRERAGQCEIEQGGDGDEIG